MQCCNVIPAGEDSIRLQEKDTYNFARKRQNKCLGLQTIKKDDFLMILILQDII
jgi:hypothetical protein